MTGGREQGWDAKAIARIAKEHYGSLGEMFKAHGWPERGQRLMPAQQRRIAEHYGSVKGFEAAHHPALNLTPEEMLDGRFSVMLTSFWGWSPESWGTVGFTSPARRNTVVSEYSDPFVVIVYVTKNAPRAERDLKGKIAGFYLVSHITGDRDEFTGPSHHQRDVEKWRHSLKALRAFSFLPEYRMPIDAFDPTVGKRAQAVAQWGEMIPQDRTDKLKGLPFVEVPVFRGTTAVDTRIHVPKTSRGRVRGGPVNRSGYWVEGEPVDTEKELYVLKLTGEVSTFLDDAVAGLGIYKIGLSMSPATRRESFNKALPGERFQWVCHRTTRMDRELPYPCFEAALAGENAMKDSLGSARWLGGEFYAATPGELQAAWAAGREAAGNYHHVATGA
tara:strand:- start:26641 stop:27807 length:1167 start_codon:yes stop_codon:yes gene_type:complete